MTFEQVSQEISQELGIQSGRLSDFFIGGALAGLIAIGIFVALLIVAAVYIYFALAYKAIAEKLKYQKSWLAWIPVAQWAMLLQLGGFHWAWIFLLLIPVFGWIALFIIYIIAMWRVFEKVQQPGWFSLSMIIPEIGFILYAIFIGLAAWQKKSVKSKPKAKKKKRSKKR
ncbi:MAG: hypothetical protein ABH864_05880 [archaeon]